MVLWIDCPSEQYIPCCLWPSSRWLNVLWSCGVMACWYLHSLALVLLAFDLAGVFLCDTWSVVAVSKHQCYTPVYNYMQSHWSKTGTACCSTARIEGARTHQKLAAATTSTRQLTVGFPRTVYPMHTLADNTLCLCTICSRLKAQASLLLTQHWCWKGYTAIQLLMPRTAAGAFQVD